MALGRAELFARLGVQATQPPEHDGPIVGVSRGRSFLGWLLLADKPRPEASAAIADLRTLGLERQVLLTGDRARVARRIGEALGMTDIRAEALPEQKMERVLREVEGGLPAARRRRRDQRQPGAEGGCGGRGDGRPGDRCRAGLGRHRADDQRSPAAWAPACG